MLRRTIKASIPLRLRSHIRLLLGRHPAELRDWFMQQQKIGRVRLLKLDVQGHELEVLAGVGSVLGLLIGSELAPEICTGR